MLTFSSKKKLAKRYPLKMSMKPAEKILKRDLLLEGIKLYEGNVSMACKYAGVGRQFYYNFTRDPAFNVMVEAKKTEADNELVQMARTSMRKLLADNNVHATMFVLKTKGGFIEASKLQIETKVEPVKGFDYSKLSMSALEEIHSLMEEDENVIECLNAYPHELGDAINDTQSITNDEGSFAVLPNNGRD